VRGQWEKDFYKIFFTHVTLAPAGGWQEHGFLIPGCEDEFVSITETRGAA
jgi:hypothetical protein